MLRPMRLQRHYRTWSAFLWAAALHLLLFLVLSDWRFYDRKSHEVQGSVVVVDIVRLEPLVVEEKADSLTQARNPVAKLPAVGRVRPAAAVVRPQEKASNPPPVQVQSPVAAEIATGLVGSESPAPAPVPAAGVGPESVGHAAGAAGPESVGLAKGKGEGADQAGVVAADRGVAPLYRHNPSPGYPGLARKRGYEGTAVFDVLVSAEGKVDTMRISSSSGHAILDQAAEDAVAAWFFTPALKSGRPTAAWVQVPVSFQLR